jgi:hypothetical protein
MRKQGASKLGCIRPDAAEDSDGDVPLHPLDEWLGCGNATSRSNSGFFNLPWGALPEWDYGVTTGARRRLGVLLILAFTLPVCASNAVLRLKIALLSKTGLCGEGVMAEPGVQFGKVISLISIAQRRGMETILLSNSVAKDPRNCGTPKLWNTVPR